MAPRHSVWPAICRALRTKETNLEFLSRTAETSNWKTLEIDQTERLQRKTKQATQTTIFTKAKKKEEEEASKKTTKKNTKT